jgi:hypothetical protein
VKTSKFFSSVVLSVMLSAGMAQAETISCTEIPSLPYTISTQGIYCLTHNLDTSITTGNAIEITVNNVTIDLNGFKLGGLGAGTATQANGIYANEKKNITIRNGIVRGFNAGIFLDDTAPYGESSGHLVEDILADQNRVYGLTIFGTGSVIRNNRVVLTGGWTGGSYGLALGITAAGDDVRVLNNEVVNTFGLGTGAGVGILLVNSHRGFVQGNRVSQATAAAGTDLARGIDIAVSDNAVITDNRVADVGYGILFRAGNGSGKYMNNLVIGASVAPYSGGTNANNNN